MSPTTMAEHHYSFPVVTGLDPGDTPASRKARMAVYARMIEELDANNQRFSQQISEIDLTDPEDARVLMPEQGADILAHFGEDHFLERYQRYQAHIAEWRQQFPRLASVDLRYDHQVVLEMASGADKTQPAPDSPAPVSPGTAKPSPEVAAAPASPPAKSAPGKAAKSRPVTKSSGSNSAKAKSASAKEKAAAKTKSVAEKKRAQSRQTALKQSHQKPSPTKRSQAPEGQ
jgi:cell division protein FtsQ